MSELQKIDQSIFNLDAPLLSPKKMRAAIFAFEKTLVKLPQMKFQLNHYIAGGMYARELLLPEGSIVTGKIHLKEHLCHVSCGQIIVVEEDKRYLVTGPATFMGKAGTKRVVLVLKNAVWTTFHTTTKATPKEAEFEVATNNYQYYLEHK